MLYSVTIQPSAHSEGLPAVRSTIEAADKDTALTQAEAAYRRLHPGALRLTMHVLRMRHGENDSTGAAGSPRRR